MHLVHIGLWGAHWLHAASVALMLGRLINSSQRTDTSCAGCTIFGPQWSSKVIQFKIDNAAVVQVIEAIYAQNSHFMHLVPIIYDFWFTAPHIPGVCRCLNCHEITRYLEDPTEIPDQLIKLYFCALVSPIFTITSL